jgi:predicted ribosomally synthesized peptide with SipW-like signal peptide
MVVGLVSIAAGGGGTFASFSAETTNAGNTFATGSLLLHDTTGGTTCTSESASTNLNNGLNGDTCHTIFSVNATDSHAHYAQLTLQNAGSLDASDIKFALASACTNAKVYESNTTLAGDATAGDTSITVATPMAIGINSGAWLYLSDGTNHEEVQVTGGPYGLNPAGGTIALATPLVNSYAAATPTNVESSPQFSGGADLCGGLDFNITETDSGFTTTTQNDTGTTGALGCAYGTATGGTDGCLFDNTSGDTLATLPTGSLNQTALTLNASPFGSGESRYFLLGIKPDSSFGNAYQDEKATFDLVWHIDQA